MPLADWEILKRLGWNLRIEPHPEVIQPASVDLHLGPSLYRLTHTMIDPSIPGQIEVEPVLFERHATIYPDDFILGATEEWVTLPNDLVGILTGKSSLARIGLQVEAAGYVDPGWDGRLTVELYNMGPARIVLRPGMAICQLRFEQLKDGVLHPYGDPELESRYQHSSGAVPARFGRLKKRLLTDEVPVVGEGRGPGIES